MNTTQRSKRFLRSFLALSALVVAGLRGGGWQGTAADLLRVEIGGGLVEAARAAAELLARAFSLPGEA